MLQENFAPGYSPHPTLTHVLQPKAIDTLADDNSVQVGSPCGRKGVCRVQELTLEGIEGWITVAARRASFCGKRGGGELE